MFVYSPAATYSFSTISTDEKNSKIISKDNSDGCIEEAMTLEEFENFIKELQKLRNFYDTVETREITKV